MTQSLTTRNSRLADGRLPIVGLRGKPGTVFHLGDDFSRITVGTEPDLGRRFGDQNRKPAKQRNV